MSQSTLPQTVDDFGSLEDSRQVNKFNYRPIPILAPVTLFLGLFSFLGLLSIIGLGVGLFGTIFGVACLVQIHRSKNELGGKIMTRIGFALSLVFLISGSSRHAYIIAVEVPEGYRRVSFYQDISIKGLLTEKGQTSIHPDVMPLDGEKIFLKGFMFPTQQIAGITSFVLVKDNKECCFGGNPKLTDMILVRLQDGLKTTYSTKMVSVAGGFRINSSTGFAGLSPVYTLEATLSEVSRSPF